MENVFHFTGKETLQPDQDKHAPTGVDTASHPREVQRSRDAISRSITTREPMAVALKAGTASISVVIPLLNEVDSLDDLYRRLKASLNECSPAHEIIFIDDGSKDGSFEKLQEFWNRDPNVCLIRFRRNFGKAAALSAGFDHVHGDLVVMMDADLQDQPEQLPRLIAKLDEGYDLVTGWKQKRHDPLNKTLPSKVFNGTVSRYYDLAIHDFNCGFKIMRSAVADDLRLYGDLHRFIPVLAAERGFRVTECAVEHAPRVHGVSKYGAKRLITGLLDFVATILTTRFTQKPMQFFGTIGLSLIAVGVILGAYSGLESILGARGSMQAVWLTALLLLVGGIHVGCIGLLCELMTNQTHRKGKPYFVTDTLHARGGQPTVKPRNGAHLDPPVLGVEVEA